MEAQEVRQAHKQYVFPNVVNYYREPLVPARGEGSWVWDADGARYLDFFGGILTVSLGHCHPRVNEAIKRQTDTLQHMSTLYPTEPMVALARRLAEISPGDLQKSFFTGSGTEADEMAVLTAKVYTKRQEVIALRHAYSGRSQLAMSLTAHAPWRNAQQPNIPGVKHTHNAYCYRCAFGLAYPACELRCIRDMEELIQTTTPGEIACFIAEPIQGVGGFITPPKEFFQIAFEITRRYGGLFISDEVQTGFGRTGGKMWGIEQYGVQPDIMTMAKGIANGAPLGATIATSEVADAFTGLSISTFGGNPVSSAAALATIDVIDQENLVANSEQMGKILREGLLDLAEVYPLIGDVRGMGLMQAIELVKDRKTKEPAKEEVVHLFEETRARGVLIGKGGLYGNVIRISPALNIGRAEIQEFLKVMRASLEVVSAGVA